MFDQTLEKASRKKEKKNKKEETIVVIHQLEKIFV